MRKRYQRSGIIGVALGGLILLNATLSRQPSYSGPYAAGRSMAIVMALVMVMAGIYYLRKAKSEE